MSSKPYLVVKRIGNRSLVFLLAFWLMSSVSSTMWGQASTAETSPGQAPAPKFEVLDGSTGSGSTSKNLKPGEQKTEFKIEVMEVPPSGGAAAEQAPQAAADGQGEAVEDSGSTEVQSPKKTKTITAAQRAKMSKEEREELEKEELLAALEEWHFKTLANYDYNIIAMDDPFMPIEQVRGIREIPIDPADLKNLPPHLQLELSQLKLVAITILSDRPGGALASFEDGAGSSYILRSGDRIGRNQGRITSITPTQVTVEEPPRRGETSPRINEIKLNVISMDGLKQAE